MSGSISDLNSSPERGMPKSTVQNKFPGEADIFRVIYPGGLIPVERMDSIPAMRSHINALLALASGQARPRKPLEAGEAQALNEKITYLKETSKEGGTTRSWPEISRILNAGFNGESCRRRYKAWKQQRRPRQTDRAALRSAAEQEDTTASEAVASLAILVHSSEKAQQEFVQVARPAAALQEGPELDENQAIPERNKTEESKEVPANKWDPGNGRGPLPESTKEEILKRYDNHWDAKEISSSMGLDGRRVQGVITGSRLSKRKGKGAESAADETLRNVPAASSEVQQKPETASCRQQLQEAKPEQSHDAQVLEPKDTKNFKQVSSVAAARALKIPHSEDEFILKERAGGKKFREIHEALQARGIECKLDDVIWRHNSLLKNVKDGNGIEAESKAPELQQSQAEPAPATEPTTPAPPGVSPEDLKWILDLAEIGWSAAEISQELMQSGVSMSTEQVAEILAGKKKNEKKPEPKHFRKGDLDAVIWKMHTKEKLSPEEISARLQEDGYSYEAGTIRTRLRAQGAKL